MAKATKTLKVHHDRFFLLGFGLFFIGLVGAVLWLQQNQQRQINHLLSEDVIALVELELNGQNLSFLQDQFNLTETQSFTIPGSATPFSMSDFTPWMGQDLALSWLPNQQFLHAFDYRNKSGATNFVNTFALPGETITELETDFGTIYTPGFSSSNAFMFHKGWLLWGDSPQTLTSQLANPSKLHKTTAYQDIQRDLPRLKFAKMYLNFAGDTSGLVSPSDNQAAVPLLRGLGSSTPQWGLAFEINDNTLQGDIKVSTHQAVYDENQVIAKAANKTIPNLAYYAPRNTLLFQNGEDLFAKYQHTKSYLNELDPQLALVFEGLIRAQSERWFGVDFDFETEFLNLIRGQYAFILDFNQGLEIGFISTLGPNQDPAAISELIKKAQSRFTPTTEEVELPDGSVRSELVAADPQTIPITEQAVGTVTYYSSNNEDGSVNFSYTQIGDYLVMANRARLIEKVILAQADQNQSLATNDDFRTSVMYEFNPAEVYGFVNAAKLNQLLFYWQETQTLTTPFNLNGLQSLRNVTFTRQVFPEVMYLKIRAFFN
jgi:hypothetical protein